MIIIRALRHYPTGALLLIAQAALACAACILSLSVMEDSRSRLNARITDGADRTAIVHSADASGGEATAQTILGDIDVLAALPGVRAAAASDAIPFGGRSSRFGICNSARAIEDAIAAGSIDVSGCLQRPVVTATEHWLDAMGMQLLQGRELESGEVTTGAPVVLLSQALARALYGDQLAVGRRIYLGPEDVRSVVGVFDAVAGPSPIGSDVDSQWAVVPGYPKGSQRYFVMDTQQGTGRGVIDTAIRRLFELDTERIIDPSKAQSLAAYRDDFLREDVFKTRLLVFLTLFVLSIMLAGVSGIVGSWVNRRRRGIGIRRALGARRRDIVSHFLIENVFLCVPGALVGLALAMAVSRLSGLAAICAWGAGTATAAIVLVMTINLLACLPPSLRAARQEPVDLLRAR